MMTTESKAGFAAGGVGPSDNSLFPMLFVAAVQRFTREPGNTPLLRAFWAAYEHRRPLEWLGESGQLPGYPDGLAFALREALSMVRYPERKQAPCPCSHVVPEDAGSRIDWQAEALSEDLPFMRSFERRITPDDACITTVDMIEQALSTALSRYVEQQDNTAPGVPW